MGFSRPIFLLWASPLNCKDITRHRDNLALGKRGVRDHPFGWFFLCTGENVSQVREKKSRGDSAIARNQKVGARFGRFDEGQVHGADGGKILPRNCLRGASSFRGIAVKSPGQSDIGVGFEKNFEGKQA